METNLFGDVMELPESSASPTAHGPFASVALEQGIDRALDYAIPAALVATLRPGQRVRVPLGKNNRPTFGYVIAISQSTTFPRIKRVLGIDDPRVLIGPEMMRLCRWMSRYYCAPLGSVLETALPSAVRKKIGLGYSQMVRLAIEHQEAQALVETIKAPKRRRILARLLQLEPGAAIELVRLSGEAGVSAPTIRKLARAGTIHITPEPDLPRLTESIRAGNPEERNLALNDDQQRALDALLPAVHDGGFSVNLLLGVTGSGKTEVYLRCIREVVNRGKRAIVLVPEIALTPQTVRRFTARFQSVAILHSGLSATERHRFWQQISLGQAQVVVGARSAIFAPTPDLGIIVVDEEHEASYKQDTIPRYNSRDVAIKRAQLHGIPVLLGSATPSLETYFRVMSRAEKIARDETRHNSLGNTVETKVSTPASSGARESDAPKSRLLRLPNRVRGLQMPHVELLDMKQEVRSRRGVHLLSQRLEHLLHVTLDAGNQAIILLNRRGYSNFVYCSSCQNAVQCKYCDATMTYHRSAASTARNATLAEGVHTGQLHCHYCLAVNPLPDKCPDCGKLLSLFGLGTQRVEEELKSKFPNLRFARVDSDSMHNSRDYEALLSRFAKGDIQVMLGTQMIAKGLDYPNVTLVGVISGDTALALPDFRSGERTFQLITQVAGRAGRGDAPGRVVLQTFLPDDPTIQFAIRQDFEGFARQELIHRREVGLPPFARIVRIVIRDQEQPKLNLRAAELSATLVEAIAKEPGPITIKGPMPCPISRIAGYHRAQIVMSASSTGPLQNVLLEARSAGALAASERIAVDVDPVSLL